MANEELIEKFAAHWKAWLPRNKNREGLYNQSIRIETLESYPSSIQNAWQRARKACGDLLFVVYEKSGVSEPKLATYGGHGPVRMLLYFDEARTLNRWTNVTGVNMLCEMLARYLGEVCHDYNVFNLFLSTHPSISRYLPVAHLSSSSRVRDTSKDYVKPHRRASIRHLVGSNKGRGPEEAYSLRGRANPRPSAPEIQGNIVRFATAQISGWSHDEMSAQGGLAALGIRILFDIDPSVAPAACLECQLVEGHMRLTHGVPGLRDYIRSGAPSEPLLAEDACRIMNGTENENTDRDWLRVPARCKSSRQGTRRHTGAAHVSHLRARQRDQADALSHRRGPYRVDPSRYLTESPRQCAKCRTHPCVEARQCPGWAHARGCQRPHGRRRVGGHGPRDGAAVLVSPLDILIPILLWDAELHRYVMSALFVQVVDQDAPARARVDAGALGFSLSSARDDEQPRPYIGSSHNWACSLL
ncbi:hypothetical protein A0H81_13830 [Grifola frondosa]|uniref:Uncharacterized protein n=1 Tax=Grifola frondosa TaxID=5627 RepID=A0A1C7LNF7_GRIFR|nr:hypothetical protein A0H81_13830 [Grifola frondosa]